MAYDVLMFGNLISDHIFSDISYNPALSIPQIAIQKLAVAMKEVAPKYRCTSEQALEYCKLLRAEGEHISLQRVEEIVHMTIDRQASTVEDILRECSRSQALM